MTAGAEKQGRSRRLAEAAFFVVLIALLWTADTFTKFNQITFYGGKLDTFRLVTEQVTSAFVVLLLVPCVAWWLTRFPLRRDRVVAAIVGLVIGSGLFAVIHYFAMVGLRYIVFLFVEDAYIFSDHWFRNLVVEYQKDLKIFFGIVAIISVYRYFRETSANAALASVGADRLIVQTGKGETVVRREEIEWLEAARNYVTISTGEREFLVRNTLSKLEQQLAAGPIVRTHRSHMVNIDSIEEILSTESGGQEIRLRSGKFVPLSRGYRDKFRSLFDEQ